MYGFKIQTLKRIQREMNAANTLVKKLLEEGKEQEATKIKSALDEAQNLQKEEEIGPESQEYKNFINTINNSQYKNEFNALVNDIEKKENERKQKKIEKIAIYNEETIKSMAPIDKDSKVKECLTLFIYTIEKNNTKNQDEKKQIKEWIGVLLTKNMKYFRSDDQYLNLLENQQLRQEFKEFFQDYLNNALKIQTQIISRQEDFGVNGIQSSIGKYKLNTIIIKDTKGEVSNIDLKNKSLEGAKEIIGNLNLSSNEKKFFEDRIYLEEGKSGNTIIQITNDRKEMLLKRIDEAIRDRDLSFKGNGPKVFIALSDYSNSLSKNLGQ